jgi:hypothetical protein
MAGPLRSLAVIDAEIAALKAKKAKLAAMPDAMKIGPNSFSGVGNAYERTKNELEELCSERDSLINNGGCRRPSRGQV